MVYRVGDGSRPPWARKIFLGDPLAKLVHIVCSGAPNPYTWNKDAIAAAGLRRRLLETLVAFWFDGHLRLPRFDGASWNEASRAFQIDMELITGRAAALAHDVTATERPEMRELVTEIMEPLQRHLRTAGFDGLVWQAGFGNPVASSNFLLENPGASPGSRRWVWIEAGHQERWRRLGRLASSLEYAERRGHVSAEAAAFYRTRPVRWYARLVRTGVARVPRMLASVARRAWPYLAPASIAAMARLAWRFISSQRWRARLASHLLRRRIRSWERRGQLSRVDSS